jgi:putative PIN family toxin of toxin-antitoxin system
MTVVLDSGIWISGFHFGGTPLLAIDKAFLFDRIAICQEIVDEVSAILVAKLGWRQTDVRSIVGSYLSDATFVALRGDLVGICRDPKDDMLFECAMRAKAELIVSGDKDVLVVGKYKSIRVVTARQYLSG